MPVFKYQLPNLEKNPLSRGVVKIHVLLLFDTAKSIDGKTSVCGQR